MLNRAQVIAAFQAVLGRDPESDLAVELHRPCPDVATLGRILLDSNEYATAAACRRLTADPRPLWVRAEQTDGAVFWVDLHDAGVSAGVLRGSWKPAETAFVTSVVKPGDTVVDAGAGIGWFTVHMARAVGPSGHVHAFEPRADLFAYLVRNVAENGLAGCCTLHRAAPRAEEGEGGSPDFRDHARTAALDGMGIEGPVRLLKLDLEGAEPDALQGAMGLLRRDKPLVVAEVHPRRMRALGETEPASFLLGLDELGYAAHTLTIDGVGGRLRRPPTDAGSDFARYSVVFLAEADREALLDGRADARVRDLEARLAARCDPGAERASRPDGGELADAVRRAEAAELRAADLAAQLLHAPPPGPSAGEDAGGERLRAELEAIRASTSWRITAPLRAAARRLKR